MIGTTGHTQLRKWKLCCSKERKLQWNVKRHCLRPFLNRFHLTLTLISMPPLFYSCYIRELISPILKFPHPFHRFGGLVGAHQLAMKMSSKRDPNGWTGGWPQSHGIPGEEPQLIKETPSKPWKWIQPSLTHTWHLIYGDQIKINIINNKDPVHHSIEIPKICTLTTPLSHLHHRKPGLSKSGQRALVALEKIEITLHLKHQAWGPTIITMVMCIHMLSGLGQVVVQVVVLHCLITWLQPSLLRLAWGLRVHRGRGHQRRRGSELDQQRKGSHFRHHQTLIVWEWGMDVMGITWGVQALRVLVEHILGWSNSLTIHHAALIALGVRFLLLQPVTLEGGWGD